MEKARPTHKVSMQMNAVNSEKINIEILYET